MTSPLSSGHIPVLMPEAIAQMVGETPRPQAVYVDATFGGGGYSRYLLETQPDCRVIAIDRDPAAAVRAQALLAAYPERLTFVAGRFGTMASLLKEAVQALGLAPLPSGALPIDGIVMDIGVSSFQIDQADRGFSFMRPGPLDMRMELAGPSAADVVNETEEAPLADILYHFGEERQSRRIAREICRERREVGPFETTIRLAEAVRRVVRKSKDGIDPATRTFQALRIFVNDEIGELQRGLEAAEAVLPEGGRLAVVSFHSLEDREVKSFLRARSQDAAGGSRLLPGEEQGAPPSFQLLTRKAVAPSDVEARQNPRARSARLRAAERTAAPVFVEDASAPSFGRAGGWR